MDVYDPSQYPNAQWAGSGAGEPFDLQPSQYGGGYAATDPAYLGGVARRGRSPYRRQQSYDQGYVDHGYNTMPSQGYQNPYAMGGIPQTPYPQYVDDDLPPLDEYYGPVPPRPLSRRSSRSRRRYSSASPHHRQDYYDQYRDYDYDYHDDRHYSDRRRRRRHSLDYSDERSYTSYDEGSNSDRSYSDDYYRPHHQSYSYSPYAQPYSTVYPYNAQPNVVYASQTHPTVVPINGGNGGYVVVPAAGQQVRVLDNRSFLSRLFSPSTWSFGDNQYAVRRRKGYQYFY